MMLLLLLLWLQGTVTKSYDIVNVDRAALGRVGGAIAKPYGDSGFKGAINLKLTGSGGQSFGVFLTTGTCMMCCCS